MSTYNYQPMRLGSMDNYSKLVHRAVGSHHLKLYGQDQKTRDKYLDHLKAQSMASVDGKKGTVAPQVYPKGWPVKNSTEFVQVEDVAGMSDQDYTNLKKLIHMDPLKVNVVKSCSFRAFCELRGYPLHGVNPPASDVMDFRGLCGLAKNGGINPWQ